MKVAFLLAAVAAALLLVWVLRRPSVPPAEPERIPDDLDGQVLKQLIAAGSDLSKPHDVEFFLYFSDEERASRAYGELTADGFAGKVDRAAKGSQWLCFVSKRIIPSHPAMVALRRRMEDLAKAGGGEYDGWGTPVSR